MRFKNGQKVPDQAFENDVYRKGDLDKASTPGFVSWRDNFIASVTRKPAPKGEKA